MRHETVASPEEAVDRLEAIYEAAVEAERAALDRFVSGSAVPTEAERAAFRYPALHLHWNAENLPPATRRAWAKLQLPGDYATTVTQPAAFRAYLLEQLRPLAGEYGVRISVGRSEQELSLIHISEPTRPLYISYAVFCLKKKTMLST